MWLELCLRPRVRDVRVALVRLRLTSGAHRAPLAYGKNMTPQQRKTTSRNNRRTGNESCSSDDRNEGEDRKKRKKNKTPSRAAKQTPPRGKPRIAADAVKSKPKMPSSNAAKKSKNKDSAAGRSRDKDKSHSASEGSSSSSDSESEQKKGRRAGLNAEERKNHRDSSSGSRVKLKKGITIRGRQYRFQIIGLIGSGGFGDVYKVAPTGSSTLNCDFGAMKTEVIDERGRPDMNRLKVELAIMKLMRTLPAAKKFHFTEMYDRGLTANFKFLVMELVGTAINTLQKSMPHREFSLASALRLGDQTLEAIDHLHAMGFLHRDIKPHNFSIGRGNKQNLIYMLDFGIARRYVKKTGSNVLRAPRKNVKFLGTIKYASRTCHAYQEQSRKDDLESWAYMLLEFLDYSTLFWSNLRSRDDVCGAKDALFAGRYKSKLLTVPPETSKILAYIDGLAYTSTPDYEYMRAILVNCARKNEVSLELPFDWETDSKEKKKRYIPKSRLRSVSKNCAQKPASAHSAAAVKEES